ncbi:hypothetical protein M885DRAFT_504454 [Pelagophyceae sp. CCMP2097]|nr:hypothetical protein M885DRAFT_504454 [Pelagophyceae sp. CCMP2097]
MARLLDEAESLEVRADTFGGLGAFARTALLLDDVVLSERALYTDSLRAAFASAAFLARPAVAAHVKTITRHANAAAATPQAGLDKYPAEARAAMDAIVELRAGDGLAALAAPQRAAVWALEDAFRVPLKGDAVCVQGLESAAGAALNGACGVVVGFSAADGTADGAAGAAPRRCRVRMDGATEVKSILPRHLKTAGGIFRTNQFADGDVAHIFETLSRFNHACGAAANVARGFVDGPRGERVVGVFCTRAVQEGDELLIDYMPEQDLELDLEKRRGLLRIRYNFLCLCNTCTAVCNTCTAHVAEIETAAAPD